MNLASFICKPRISLGEIFVSNFYKHQHSILNTPSTSSVKTTIVYHSPYSSSLLATLEADLSKMVNEVDGIFTHSVQSSLTALKNEVTNLQSYVTSSKKDVSDDYAKIQRFSEEATARINAWNASISTYSTNIAQANDLINKLTTVISGSLPISSVL